MLGRRAPTSLAADIVRGPPIARETRALEKERVLFLVVDLLLPLHTCSPRRDPLDLPREPAIEVFLVRCKTLDFR